jgi:acyl-coenzyme A synthetase/AMP-(fatty) acid ligase
VAVDLARNLIGRINVGDQLPNTSTGKIQKNVVRSEHAAHYEG